MSALDRLSSRRMASVSAYVRSATRVFRFMFSCKPTAESIDQVKQAMVLVIDRVKARDEVGNLLKVSITPPERSASFYSSSIT